MLAYIPYMDPMGIRMAIFYLTDGTRPGSRKLGTAGRFGDFGGPGLVDMVVFDGFCSTYWGITVSFSSEH